MLIFRGVGWKMSPCPFLVWNPSPGYFEDGPPSSKWAVVRFFGVNLPPFISRPTPILRGPKVSPWLLTTYPSVMGWTMINQVRSTGWKLNDHIFPWKPVSFHHWNPLNFHLFLLGGQKMGFVVSQRLVILVHKGSPVNPLDSYSGSYNVSTHLR